MSKHASSETSPSKRARTGAVAARESGPVPSVQARPQRASASAAAAAFAPLPAPARAQRSEAQKALSVLKAKETKAQKAREKAEKAREKAEKEAQQDIADADNQVLKAAKRASVAVQEETLFPGPNTQQLEADIEETNLVIAGLLEKLAANASRAEEIEEAARQEHSATAEQSARHNQLLESLAQSNMKLGRELVNARERLATANSAKVIGQHAAQQHNVSQLTAEEGEATRRLEGLGFPRARVLEAYFACDKSEELAANYLFDHVD